MLSSEHSTIGIFTEISQKYDLELAKAVSDNRENILDSKDQNGKTVLHYAAKFGRVDIIISILEILGITVNITDKEGFTPLFDAAGEGVVEAIKVLIRYGTDVNHLSRYKQTALMVAAGGGHKDAVKILIENKANINQFDHYNKSAIFFACYHNHPEMVNVLIFNGAKDDLNEIAKTVIKTTAHTRALELLTSYGASAKEMFPYAIGYGRQELAEFLISKIPDNWKDKDSMTPLLMAASKGYINIINYLLNRGVDVNQHNKYNQTALLYAAKCGFLEATELLIKHGAILDFSDNLGQSPIFYSTRDGKTGTTASLLKYGANVNHTDRDGNTPLHIAAANKHIETLELLLKHGANLNHADREQNTALAFAAKEKCADIAKLLIEHGATTDISRSKIASSLQDYIKAQKWCNGSNITTGISEQTKNIIKTIITNKLAQDPSILVDASLTAKLQELGIEAKDIFYQCVTNSIENAVDAPLNPFYQTLLVISAITLKQQEETKQSDVQDITEILSVVTVEDTPVTLAGSAAEITLVASEEHC